MPPREPSISEPKPTGAEQVRTLGGSGRTQMGLSRLVVTLPLLLPGLCPGGSRVPRVGEEREGHPVPTRLAAPEPHSPHFAGAAAVFCSVTRQMTASISGQAGRTLFFFFLCTIGCFSVPAPGAFNLIGEKRKRNDPFMASLLVSKQKALIKSEK